MPVPIQWTGEPALHHREVVETANRLYDFLPQVLSRVYAFDARSCPFESITLALLATGGAMAVYKLTVTLTSHHPYHLVCKIPHPRRIVYAPGTEQHTDEDTTRQLLERLVTLSEHLAQHTPGLFPRHGGLWHWQSAAGNPQYLWVEEFIAGLSVERLKHRYEQQLLAGEISSAAYQQRRRAMERLAVATFSRLWDALGRRLFTSDPSPWNVLVHLHEDEPVVPLSATVIDLHGLEDAGLSYVVQRLTAIYGMHQDVLEHALLPGIYDALGETAGRALLLAELPNLEAQAAQTKRNLGVDLYRPLLNLIAQLA